MEIVVAKTAGFCFGVKRAVDEVYAQLKNKKLVTYGPIIHNEIVTNDLRKNGVKIINDLSEVEDETVVIRSHGIKSSDYHEMEIRNINYIDCTCPYVKKIHNIVKSNYEKNFKIIIIGDFEHPEVVGINGWANDECIIINNPEQVAECITNKELEYAIVVQTTFRYELYKSIIEQIKLLDIKFNVNNTICKATNDRQDEADDLSQKVDKMIVIGDKKSSNTIKLFEICKKNCKNTILIQQVKDLLLNILLYDDKIGITAGASTPPEIIKEAVNFMSELENNTQSFEEMLNESLVTLHTGEVVKGTVIHVTNVEVSVNLGYKSDGIIPKSEFTEDPNVNIEDTVKVGDEIETLVLRVNDGEGNVLLSKKRLEAQKGWDKLEDAFNNKSPISGKFVDIVKGGLIALINNIKVFVPSSQASSRYTEDLKSFVGKEVNFNIIEFDKSKRRLVAGRRELAAKEENERKVKVFASLNVGDRIEGVVSRVVDFGAFCDLGGVDGLIHISEMSWGRVKRASDVLSEGDKVIVTVLEKNNEKSKISLSLKDINNDPWLRVSENFPIGEIIEGKVVRMAQFGAFVELTEGVDGLVHVSQISHKHVVKPEDALTIGEIIKVKVTDIDLENKRISLSKKEAEPKESEPTEENQENNQEIAEDAQEVVNQETAEE